MTGIPRKRYPNKPVPPERRAWHQARQRCNCKTHKQYADYGGRGITVCKRWNVYENFIADMEPRPPGYTLERRNNSKGYSPSNCYWATQAEQQRNRRDTIKLTFKGETLCVAEWARRLGLSPVAVHQRLKLGWTIRQAVTLPAIKGNQDHVNH